MTRETEVTIVGGGVIGLATARELSKYKVDITLVEKEPDVGWGTTKCTTSQDLTFDAAYFFQGLGAIEGFKDMAFGPPGEPNLVGWERKTDPHVDLRGRIMGRSVGTMEKLCKELDVPYVSCGNIWVCKNKYDYYLLDKGIQHAKKYGYNNGNKIIDKKTLLELEPNINPDRVIGGLYSPEAGCFQVFRLCSALAENARQNGVNILTDSEVKAIERERGGSFILHTAKGDIRTRFVVNAAGLDGWKVAAMVKANNFSTFTIKIQFCILDKKVRNIVKHHVLARGKYNFQIVNIGATADEDASVLLGHAAFFGSKRWDHRITEREFMERIFIPARELYPMISEKDVIRTVAGSLTFENPDSGDIGARIETAPNVPRFVNVVIAFPGSSACVAIAEVVREVLEQEGMPLVKNQKFNPRSEGITDFSKITDRERDAIIAKNPAYSHMVCRCETVPEGEIIEAIRRGATTVDGVKQRVRAGMGRCQGGFCGPRVLEILSRELHKPKEEILLNSKGSRVLYYKSKYLLKEGESDY